MHCNNVQLPLWRSPQLYVQSSLLTVLADRFCGAAVWFVFEVNEEAARPIS